MKTAEAVEQLGAMAHETRLEIFRLLVRAGATGLAAGEIASRLDVAPPTLSFHLKELRAARLIEVQRVGRSQIYRADYDTMRALLGFLADECCRDEQNKTTSKVDAPRRRQPTEQNERTRR